MPDSGSEIPSGPDTAESTPGAGLGTFGGVFTPSTLTILGVIMYLRFGWVVGNGGMAEPGDGFRAYYERMQEMTRGLPTTLFVLASEDLEFTEVLGDADHQRAGG